MVGLLLKRRQSGPLLDPRVQIQYISSRTCHHQLKVINYSMLLCFEIMFMNWILLDQNRGVAGNGRAHSLSVRANTNIQCVPFRLKGTPGWKEQEPIERRAKTALRRQSPDTKGGKVVPAQCRSQFPKISVSRAAKQRRPLPLPINVFSTILLQTCKTGGPPKVSWLIIF